MCCVALYRYYLKFKRLREGGGIHEFYLLPKTKFFIHVDSYIHVALTIRFTSEMCSKDQFSMFSRLLEIIYDVRKINNSVSMAMQTALFYFVLFCSVLCCFVLSVVLFPGVVSIHKYDKPNHEETLCDLA